MTSNYTATLFHGGSVRTMNAASVNANNVLPGHTGAFSRLKYGSVQKPYRSRQHYYFDAGYTNHGQHIGTNNSGTASNFGVNQTDDQDYYDQEDLKSTPVTLDTNPEGPHWKKAPPRADCCHPWEYCVHSDDRGFSRSADNSQQGHSFRMSPALQEYIGHLQKLAQNSKPTDDDDEVMSECGIQESDNSDTAMDQDDDEGNGSGDLASSGGSMPFTPIFQDNRKYMTTNVHQQILIFGQSMT